VGLGIVDTWSEVGSTKKSKFFWRGNFFAKMGQGGGWRGLLEEEEQSEEFVREFSEMYSKIETNDEGDISMRNVVTHIQI